MEGEITGMGAPLGSGLPSKERPQMTRAEHGFRITDTTRDVDMGPRLLHHGPLDRLGARWVGALSPYGPGSAVEPVASTQRARM